MQCVQRYRQTAGGRWTVVLALCVVLLGMGVGGCDSQEAMASAGEDDEGATDSIPVTRDLSGARQNVHDPAIIKAHGQYYLYSTGGGIQRRSSPDRMVWTHHPEDVLDGVPDWAKPITDGDLWAPDIAFFNGRDHLYYSASTFGSGRSAIGVATSPGLSVDSAAWTDREK